MCCKVLPLSWLSNPLTFSIINIFGRIKKIILINSNKAWPFESSNPFPKPAYEKDWQGEPPTTRSTLFWNFEKLKFCILLLTTVRLGWFLVNVLQLSKLLSIQSSGGKPASINPWLNPPAPENISIKVYWREVWFKIWTYCWQSLTFLVILSFKIVNVMSFLKILQETYQLVSNIE